MAKQQALATTVRNLERQMGQLASAQITRPAGALPSDTEPNPKAQVNAVTLRNGRALEEVPKKKKNTDHPEGELAPKPVEGNEKDDKGPKPVIETRPPPPFPQRLQKQKDDAKYKKFLDILSQVIVNLPFVEILYEVPKYARYLRDIVANKRRHAEFETVGRALCDLGASINLMPSSLFKLLGLGTLRPTTITLQLADRSLVMPEGIIEDVLVRVGKFILPADFIVLDYEAYEEVSIILGRPFLATGGAIIDVRAGKLKMRVDDEEVTFNVYKALKLSKQFEDLCMITVVESKGIKQSPYVNYTDPDGTTELKE
uniref:Aspartic peptidase DDI1-type domain-containing protein n=1 Tax=Nicotiana tabacum TaxID=4097 RepID=A0A1S3ZE09_TOBAC